MFLDVFLVKPQVCPWGCPRPVLDVFLFVSHAYLGCLHVPGGLLRVSQACPKGVLGPCLEGVPGVCPESF